MGVQIKLRADPRRNTELALRFLYLFELEGANFCDKWLIRDKPSRLHAPKREGRYLIAVLQEIHFAPLDRANLLPINLDVGMFGGTEGDVNIGAKVAD